LCTIPAKHVVSGRQGCIDTLYSPFSAPAPSRVRPNPPRTGVAGNPEANDHALPTEGQAGGDGHSPVLAPRVAVDVALELVRKQAEDLALVLLAISGGRLDIASAGRHHLSALLTFSPLRRNSLVTCARLGVGKCSWGVDVMCRAARGPPRARQGHAQEFPAVETRPTE
jgi:hypothetical protein